MSFTNFIVSRFYRTYLTNANCYFVFFHYFTLMFKKRESVFEIEEGKFLSPKFDKDGLIPVTTDSSSGELLMHGYMNEEALKKTIETKEGIIGADLGKISGTKEKLVVLFKK